MCMQTKTRRPVKPAACESAVVCKPIAPCVIFPDGMPGTMSINGTEYAVVILGWLPDDGVSGAVIDGYRLTKSNGESHDLCLIAGRLECTCGDWIWRRSYQSDRVLADCKHCRAIKQHLCQPDDQRPLQTCGADIEAL